MPQYLRTFRKQAGFTQSDLACLLSVHTAENVSRYERLSRRPTLETAFGCQVIFNACPHELFPGLYREVEQGVRKRARQIWGRLGRAEREMHARKWAVYEALANSKPNPISYGK